MDEILFLTDSYYISTNTFYYDTDDNYLSSIEYENENFVDCFIGI